MLIITPEITYNSSISHKKIKKKSLTVMHIIQNTLKYRRYKNDFFAVVIKKKKRLLEYVLQENTILVFLLQNLTLN